MRRRGKGAFQKQGGKFGLDLRAELVHALEQHASARRPRSAPSAAMVDKTSSADSTSQSSGTSADACRRDGLRRVPRRNGCTTRHAGDRFPAGPESAMLQPARRRRRNLTPCELHGRTCADQPIRPHSGPAAFLAKTANGFMQFAGASPLPSAFFSVIARRVHPDRAAPELPVRHEGRCLCQGRRKGGAAPLFN